MRYRAKSVWTVLDDDAGTLARHHDSVLTLTRDETRNSRRNDFYRWVTITLIMLFLTACTNPGIYPVVREIPESSNQRWAYCKETDSYRPPGVIYDEVRCFDRW